MFLLHCSGANALQSVCQIPLRGRCTCHVLEELDEEEKTWKKARRQRSLGKFSLNLAQTDTRFRCQEVDFQSALTIPAALEVVMVYF